MNDNAANGPVLVALRNLVSEFEKKRLDRAVFGEAVKDWNDKALARAAYEIVKPHIEAR